MIGNLDYFKWISPDPEWLKHRVDAKGLENVDKTEFGLFIPQVVNAAQREITLAKNQRVNLEIWHAAKFPHGSYIFLNPEKLAGIDLGRAAKSVPNQPLILDMYIQFVADNYADKEWSKWRLHMESFETIRLESLH